VTHPTSDSIFLVKSSLRAALGYVQRAQINTWARDTASCLSGGGEGLESPARGQVTQFLPPSPPRGPIFPSLPKWPRTDPSERTMLAIVCSQLIDSLNVFSGRKIFGLMSRCISIPPASFLKLNPLPRCLSPIASSSSTARTHNGFPQRRDPLLKIALHDREPIIATLHRVSWFFGFWS